jgi:nifR3 family TIM-barrel protein
LDGSLNGIELAGRLLLAPIAGYTDSPYRRIAARHGAGLTVTELISAEGIVRKNRNTTRLLEFHDGERPLAIQIFGKSAGVMAGAASIVEELGPDVIDINLGCPAPKVCGSGSGAALLLDPVSIREIVSAVVSAVSLPVTAKIRLGWDDKSRNYMDVVKAIEDSGARAVIVHGRTRAQKYGGLADWDAIREIRENCSLPVIGNGDISGHDEALARMESSGCQAVMIGRGALGNPWIFSGKTPSHGEIVSLIKEHLDMMLDFYGGKGIILFRKHMVKYIRDMRNASALRGLLMAAATRDEIISILDGSS